MDADVVLFAQLAEESFDREAIGVAEEDVAFVDALVRDVVPGAWLVVAWCSCHASDRTQGV